MENQKNYHHYSSKVKSIFVELKNYTFYHRPSDEKNPDKRFIGREKVKEKLKTIITNSEVKSGAYLITGFRGMGKTSVINKVLEELKGFKSVYPLVGRYVRIMVAVLLFSVFDTVGVIFYFGEDGGLLKGESFLLVYFPLIMLVIAFILIYKNNKERRNLTRFNKIEKPGTPGLPTILKGLRPAFEYKKQSRSTSVIYLLLAQDYIIASIIHLLVLAVVYRYQNSIGAGEEAYFYSFKFVNYIIAAIIVFSELALINEISIRLKKPSDSKLVFLLIIVGISIGGIFYTLYNLTATVLLLSVFCINWRILKSKIFAFVSHSHIVPIKINLGQEKLKEKDILRLIAKSVFEEYKKIIRPFSSVRRFLWKFSSFLILYVFILTIYHYRPTYSIISEIRTELGIGKYFPSQAIFSYRNIPIDYDLDGLVVKDIEAKEVVKDEFNYADYYETIHDFRNINSINESLKDLSVLQQYNIFEKIQTVNRYSVFTQILKENNAAFDANELDVNRSSLTLNLSNPTHLDFLLKRKLRIKSAIKNIIGPNNKIEIKKTSPNTLSVTFKPELDLLVRDDLEWHLRNVENDDDWLIYMLRQSPSSNGAANVTSSDVRKITSRNDFSRTIFEYDQLSKFSIRLDYFIYTLYTDFSHFLFEAGESIFKESNKNENGQHYLNRTLDLHSNFHILPPRLDYLFLLFYLCFWLVFRLLKKLKLLGVDHHQVLKELGFLIESIDASISTGSDTSVGSKKIQPLFYFGLTRKKVYPMASEREIETRLIQILSLSERIPFIRMRPKFVFIFDELDKIEPTGTYKEENEEKIDYYVTEGTRKRQQTIGRILSNLKHFFNTAKAKFIFIAGREMYDAAIADVSDRDSLIGSLFHEVIYVNSFFKDPFDGKLSDITSMTERYVCQFLLPEGIGEPSLFNYRKYLESEFQSLEGIGSKIDPKDEARIIGKAIFTLQNFITYLAYRSNGSPKKITKIFEEYVVSLDVDGREENEYPDLYLGRNKSNLFLRFKFYDQYVFGFTSFLFNPFVFNINKHLQDYGDKLLVSTTFLLNHIYKFHGTGFSYRTLEMTPEIIAVNKAPELRGFIDSLLNFLSKIHIREILSGLHQFKFNSRIEREIKFISKISEKESAAHNFTLDESIEIKRLYKRKLDEVGELYGTGKEDSKLIEASAYLNLILGDLHYHDQELDSALLHYQRALLPFRDKPVKEFDIESLIFFIRAELKLGITFEKKRNYDDALLIYESLKNKVIAFSLIFKPKFKIKFNDSGKKDYPKFSKEDSLNNEKELGSRVLLAIRLMYQPFLAELQLIEKHTIKSLTKFLVLEHEIQFRNVVNKLNPEQAYILAAEQYDKTGDVLFYKSGILFGHIIEKKGKIRKEESYKFFIDLKKQSREEKEGDNEGKVQFVSYPVSAFKYYLYSLSVSVKCAIKEDFKVELDTIQMDEKFSTATELLHECTLFLFKSKSDGIKEFPATRKTVFTTIANSLSDVGDCILCFVARRSDEEISVF